MIQRVIATFKAEAGRLAERRAAALRPGAAQRAKRPG
jgi:hypothetical protein